MGHMVGQLCDEYDGGADAYGGGEPGCVNLTINTDRGSIKWGDFINPNTPLPTVFDAATMDRHETAGAFEGGTLWDSAIGQRHRYATDVWHPTSRGAPTWHVRRLQAPIRR